MPSLPAGIRLGVKDDIHRKLVNCEMFYHEFPIHPELADFVQVIWAMESTGPEEAFPRERILPDGIVELVLHYRDPFVTYLADGSSYSQPFTFAISQMKRYIEIESTGSIGLMAVRFFPWGAYRFLRTPVKTFLDDYVDGETLWGSCLKPLLGDFQDANEHEDRVGIVSEFLLARLRELQRRDELADMGIKLCRDCRGQITVEKLAEVVGLSRRQLDRRLLDTLGTTPKTFCRVSRFLDVCHHLKDYAHRTLAQLTQDCGYFDQSHFIREFKEFSGFTPQQFFAKNNVVFADL